MHAYKYYLVHQNIMYCGIMFPGVYLLTCTYIYIVSCTLGPILDSKHWPMVEWNLYHNISPHFISVRCNMLYLQDLGVWVQQMSHIVCQSSTYWKWSELCKGWFHCPDSLTHMILLYVIIYVCHTSKDRWGPFCDCKVQKCFKLVQ